MANNDAYSNPGTQLLAQNKDFSAGWQTDETRGLVSSVAQAIPTFTGGWLVVY